MRSWRAEGQALMNNYQMSFLCREIDFLTWHLTSSSQTHKMLLFQAPDGQNGSRRTGRNLSAFLKKQFKHKWYWMIMNWTLEFKVFSDFLFFFSSFTELHWGNSSACFCVSFFTDICGLIVMLKQQLMFCMSKPAQNYNWFMSIS